MDIEAFVTRYYDALRAGDPLAPYFATELEPLKFGITENLYGDDAVAEGLREQTRTTSDWAIESHRLRTGTHESMAWTDVACDERIDWETRWSGIALEKAGEWRFLSMHVSAAADDLT